MTCQTSEQSSRTNGDLDTQKSYDNDIASPSTADTGNDEVRNLQRRSAADEIARETTYKQLTGEGQGIDHATNKSLNQTKDIYSHEADPLDGDDLDFARHELLGGQVNAGHNRWDAKETNEETGITPVNYSLLRGFPVVQNKPVSPSSPPNKPPSKANSPDQSIVALSDGVSPASMKVTTCSSKRYDNTLSALAMSLLSGH